MSHLLVAEDSAIQRAALVSDLEAAGFHVTAASDGQEALELLGGEARGVDLLISDVVMPRVDGLELCRRVKTDAQLPDLPVVLLTSLQDPLDIVHGLEVGADNFLTKPYDPEHLVSRVHALVTARTGRAATGNGSGSGTEGGLQLLDQEFAVTAERQQILELLVGAFEDLVSANQKLRERGQELTSVQQSLSGYLDDVEHEQNRLMAVLDAIPDGVVIVGRDGTITDLNPAAVALGVVGPEGRPAVGIPVQDVSLTVLDELGREVPPSAWPLARAYQEGVPTATGADMTLRLADGRLVPVTVTAAPVSSGGRPPHEAVAVVRDVSVAAFYDQLTALPNRTLFADRIALALEHAQTEDTQVGLAVLSLDRFDVVNTSVGRVAEDTLISVFAQRLVDAVGSDATVARLGGDRFGLLLEDVGHITGVLRVAASAAGVLDTAVTLGDEEVFLSTSIGVVASGTQTDPERLLRQATMAMHRAIESGGATTEVYDEDLDAAGRRRIFLAAALHRALEQDEFVVHFQPVVELATGRTVESEALVRWQHPDEGLISPGDFIPIAEESGVIVELGLWVLEQACAQTQQWRTSGTAPDMRVSVNLSGRQFEDPDLHTDIDRILRTTGLPPAALTLEVTETALIREPGSAAAVLDGLRELGVRVAIDDFGTGYSSLSYLRTFRADVLKIDQAFVDPVAADPEAAAIVQAIITLAGALGLEVIAEGVETQEQLDWLTGSGCDLAAGYFLSHPVPAETLEPLLAGSLVPGR